MIKRIIVSVLLLGVSNVFASNQTGAITRILVRTDGLHWFYVSGDRTEKPICATNNYWIIKDEESAYGKSQMSMLLTAYSMGKTVTIQGEGNCTRWGDGENIGTVILN
jgi:hypothetical protein